MSLLTLALGLAFLILARLVGLIEKRKGGRE